jgi:predicted nucleic acid-binding protein
MNREVIIDTNLIFAFLHRNQAKSARFFFSEQGINFLTPNFFVYETFLHHDILLEKSKGTKEATHSLFEKVVERLCFVNETTISVKNFVDAYYLCRDVDDKDTPFIALSLELNAPLWTRDTILKEHLISKDFTNFFDENLL